jgi:hypothetical protein
MATRLLELLWRLAHAGDAQIPTLEAQTLVSQTLKEVGEKGYRVWGRLEKEWLNCSLNHVNCSLNHVNCSLNHVNCSLNHVNCSLNHVNCSLNHVNCSLSHVNCSLNHVNCSLNHVNCSQALGHYDAVGAASKNDFLLRCMDNVRKEKCTVSSMRLLKDLLHQDPLTPPQVQNTAWSVLHITPLSLYSIQRARGQVHGVLHAPAQGSAAPGPSGPAAGTKHGLVCIIYNTT